MTLNDLYLSSLVTEDTIIYVFGDDWKCYGHWFTGNVSYVIHCHRDAKVVSMMWADMHDTKVLYINVEE